MTHLVKALQRHLDVLGYAELLRGISFQSGLLRLNKYGLLDRETAREIMEALFALDDFYHPRKQSKAKPADLQDAANARRVRNLKKCSDADAMIAVLAVTGRKLTTVERDSLAASLKNRSKNLTVASQMNIVLDAIAWLDTPKDKRNSAIKWIDNPER